MGRTKLKLIKLDDLRALKRIGADRGLSVWEIGRVLKPLRVNGLLYQKDYNVIAAALSDAPIMLSAAAPQTGLKPGTLRRSHINRDMNVTVLSKLNVITYSKKGKFFVRPSEIKRFMKNQKG